MILIKTTITEERPFDVTVRAWPKMKTLAMQRAGDHWHARMFPKHFEYSAKTRYNHQPRKRGYLIRKQRLAALGRPDRQGGGVVLAPGNVDNVLTGRMKQSLMATVKIRAFPTRATVIMTGPKYALMRPYKSSQPNKGKELTTVTAEEQQKLETLLGDTMEKLVKNFRARRVVEI